MKIILSIEHPAWAHQFRYVIKELEKKGHIIKVVAINKDRDLELLNIFGIPYEIVSKSSGKNIIEKGFIFLGTTLKIFLISCKYKPDMFIGRASPMMSINSFLLRKPHILFTDTEHARFSLMICKLFSEVILTPSCFMKSLGKKQLRLDAYKELFYLHPKHFQPNLQTLKDLQIEENEKIIIIRFIAWDAHHDVGQRGIHDKVSLVEALEPYGRILITSEGPLPPELEHHRIQISPEKLHDILYFSTLYIGEGSTTASECAVLGTHAIYVNTLRLGYTNEEEERYNLIYTISDTHEMEKGVLNKAIELLKDPDLRIKGKQKRQKLLSDKIDVTKLIIWFIDNYPGSLTRIKNDPYFQEQFRTPKGKNEGS
nr:DUF354 domain-containing protein [uncultured Methanoregula sp.]